jgi:hypothetical protein
MKLFSTNMCGYVSIVGVFSALSMMALVVPLHAATPFTVTAQSGARQTFRGFGASHVNEDGSYEQMSAGDRAALARYYFSPAGADMRIVRCWTTLDPALAGEGDGRDNVEWFVYRFKQVIEDGRAVQPNLIVLMAPDYSKNNRTFGDHTAYAAGYANIIKRLKDEHDIIVDATGIANEPNGVSPDVIIDMVKKFREQLDAQGLQNVKVIAPETSSGGYSNMLNAFMNNAAGLAALDGFSQHSYNDAVEKSTGDLVAQAQQKKGSTLEFWQTESSSDKLHGDNNDTVATILMATILGDLNNMVTHWVYFVGFAPGNSGSYLVSINTDDEDAFRPLLQMIYLKQLSAAFRSGARFRRCMAAQALPRPEMTWQYGQKPAVVVGVAQNEDDTWAVGIINSTGLGVTNEWQGSPIGYSYPAQTFDVTVTVDELDGKDVEFTQFHSNVADRIVEDGKVTMSGGSITLTVEPRNLITLCTPVVVSTREREIGKKRAELRIRQQKGLVRIWLPEATHTLAEVVDTRGREVAVHREIGREIMLNTARYAPGTYLIRVNTPSRVYSARILVEG